MRGADSERTERKTSQFRGGEEKKKGRNERIESLAFQRRRGLTEMQTVLLLTSDWVLILLRMAWQVVHALS